MRFLILQICVRFEDGNTGFICRRICGIWNERYAILALTYKHERVVNWNLCIL